MWASAKKVLKGQELSGMGCLKIFWVKGKEAERGGGAYSPCILGLIFILSSLGCWK